MANRAVGTKIQIGAQFIASVKSIGGLELTADTIDTTTLDSDGGYKEFISSFKDAGEVSIEGFFVPGDSGQAAVYAAFESGATNSYSIIFPASMGASWAFNGVVTGFSTTDIEVDGAIGFAATIKVSGKPNLGLVASGGLSALTVTGAGGTLTPAFSNGNYSYTYSGVTSASITVTATAANHKLKLYADGVFVQDLTSGSASTAIPLTLNVGKDITIVAYEDGKTQKVYEIIAVKTA